MHIGIYLDFSPVLVNLFTCFSLYSTGYNWFTKCIF